VLGQLAAKIVIVVGAVTARNPGSGIAVMTLGRGLLFHHHRSSHSCLKSQ
jgi:hypothetical protein